ncbi:MAG TPA: c-type cytochrome, partial [Pirellulales bacterium]|nr:c-type cytochrome [Pirellulales bacterium]
MKKITSLMAFLLFAFTVTAFAEPVWIWTKKNPEDNERADFKTEFEIAGEVKAATLKLTCDNGAIALINGKKVLENADWDQVSQADVKAALKPGKNEILVEASNHGGAAALIAALKIELVKGKPLVIETSDKWLATKHGKSDWKAAVVMGKNGAAPWGDIFNSGRRPGGASSAAIDPKEITAPPGFKVELLYNVPKAQQGSWVSMTVDKKGRIICGDQNGGLYRLTPSPIGSEAKSVVEPIEAAIGGAHGILYAYDSLYYMLNEGAPQTRNKPHGLYRAKDKDGDDHFETPVLLSECDGGGEHGPHSPVLGPDGNIYFNCGNHTPLPRNLSTSRAVMKSWDEDQILPRMWDTNGHARGIMAPGGYICKTDRDGHQVELFCSGFRNEFDYAFDANGEMFTYDADMEWDIGAPWYRPTRINFCASGGEFGWRSGSGKWPAYYEDSLPAVVNIGPGSPTGLIFGTEAKFPAKYQRALFGNDWTYGTMYAIHFEPSGAGFKGVKEEFVYGRPLPLTDVVINPHDGAMYFAVGGRGTQSAVYRVSYQGPESTDRVEPYSLTKEMLERRALEKFHQGEPDVANLPKIWPALGSSDRNLRFAARIALERLPVKAWSDKVLAEKDPQTLIEGAIALARLGRTEKHIESGKPSLGHSSPGVGPTSSADGVLLGHLLNALAKLNLKTLTPDMQMQLVRAHQLCFTRLGKPDAAVCAQVAARFDAVYPMADAYLNRELCQLLVFLDSKSVASKTLGLMATAKDDTAALATNDLLNRNAGYGQAAFDTQNSRPNQQQIALMFALRNCTAGWTPELRQTYFSWFQHAQTWKGGNSFKGFIQNARAEALANFAPQNERARLEELSGTNKHGGATFTPPKGPGRSYSTEDVLKIAEGGMTHRNFAAGKNLFNAGLCAACHHFNGDGGNIGPDITKAGNRYTLHDLIENITEPSKVISDQYGSHQILKTDGTGVTGRIVGEENGKLIVMTNPFAPDLLISIDEKEVESKRDFPVSMMPLGLLNTMNEDEIKDLLAY